MTLSSTRHHVVANVRHRGWESPESRPTLSNEVGDGRHDDRFQLTSRMVTREGAPIMPVTGELHYSRVPRVRWRRRLEQMRAGGVTAVSTYVIWLHHQPSGDAPAFTGDLDVRAFVETCREVGLPVVLRIGPWVHGEVRNGGLPDWVQHSGAAVRTNDPAYLAMVGTWFAALAEQVGAACRAEGSVIAIQIENELYDQPEHLRTLKNMAKAAGLTAPIYSATGWGSAQLPTGELLPLFGGYADGFWVDTDAPWEPSFREHFFFSHRWDDPGIGADLRTSDAGGAASSEPRFSGFPAATCELGGGMATAYHRRPVLTGLDVAAVAHNKIGNGSAWQGYYMYAGGTNPSDAGPTQESHETRYPNDMPRWDYDFHAPIGAGGSLAESEAHLRRQHTFLASFGDRLAPMSSSLPDHTPSDVFDRSTLRWALRSDGESGFVLISWHQAIEPLQEHPPVRFRLELDGGQVEFPDAPVTIPAGTLAHWPVGLTLNGVPLEWATASALSILSGDVPILVLTAERGIAPELRFAAGTVLTSSADAVLIDGSGAVVSEDTDPVLIDARTGEARLRILVLPFETGLAARVQDGRLLIADEPLWRATDGRASGESLGTPTARAFDPRSGAFERVRTRLHALEAPSTTMVSFERSAAPGTPPASYGSLDGRASAPTDDDFVAAGTFELDLTTREADDSLRRELVIDWVGDVARLLVGGVPVADRFWDGTPWSIDIDTHDREGDNRIEVQLLPLVTTARVHLASAAAALRAASAEPLCAIHSVELRTWVTWTEVDDA